MKILRLARKCGSPCGGLLLSSLIDGSLPSDYLDGHVISLRDSHCVTTLPKQHGEYRPSYFKMFTLGEAQATVFESLDKPESGRQMVNVSIESPNAADFVALYNSIYRDWLGIPHEDIPVPKQWLREPSLIRGIRNDLRDLRQLLKNRWRRARAMTFGQMA